MACPSCDWLHVKDPIQPDQKAKCIRCSELLYTHNPRSLDTALAATLAGLVFLMTSLYLPFLTLSRAGLDSSISLLDAAWSLVFSDIAMLGAFVLLLIVLVPMVRMMLLAYVLIHIKLNISPNRVVKRALRLALFLEPWAMADVFLIGVVVSLIKISELAVLEIGPAFWSWIFLIITTILLSMTLSRESLWQRIHPS